MRAFVTSYREGAVVSSVYDEAVHMQGDGGRLGVGGIVPLTVVLQEETAHVKRGGSDVFKHVGVREIIPIQDFTSVPQQIYSPVKEPKGDGRKAFLCH